jgi:hypothetical protein
MKYSENNLIDATNPDELVVENVKFDSFETKEFAKIVVDFMSSKNVPAANGSCKQKYFSFRLNKNTYIRFDFGWKRFSCETFKNCLNFVAINKKKSIRTNTFTIDYNKLDATYNKLLTDRKFRIANKNVSTFKKDLFGPYVTGMMRDEIPSWPDIYINSNFSFYSNHRYNGMNMSLSCPSMAKKVFIETEFDDFVFDFTIGRNDTKLPSSKMKMEQVLEYIRNSTELFKKIQKIKSEFSKKQQPYVDEIEQLKNKITEAKNKIDLIKLEMKEELGKIKFGNLTLDN